MGIGDMGKQGQKLAKTRGFVPSTGAMPPIAIVLLGTRLGIDWGSIAD
ncbi:hypothetical protein GFS31_02050 [Leptolyngbya sp. BL0902]|nr:hypothetical protein GFS31_02050 [Leptolyngbya sp. BL0902]